MTATRALRQNWTLEDLALHFGPIELHRPVSREEFLTIAEHNPNLQIEREPDGTVTLMSPLKKGSGRRESKLHGLLFMWNFQNKKGEVFGSNGTFDLPNGAIKMPDVSWISAEKTANQPDDEEQFIQTVPDFVGEVRSSSDRLDKLKKKMTDSWMANGVRLAWLIDPYEEKAYIYREGQPEPEIVEGFAGRSLSGEAVLEGFTLSLDTMRRR